MTLAMLGTRLAAARKAVGMHQVDLAAALGDRYNQSMISMVECGQRELRASGIILAARELNVSVDYLYGLTDDPAPYTELAEKIDNPDFRNLAVRDAEGSMGSGSHVEDDPIIGYLAFRTVWLKKHGINPDKASMIEVRGDSMQPTIRPGSMVLVDHKRTRRVKGRIFALRTEDGVLVKRVMKDGDGGWQLISDNPDYETVPFPKDGKVLGEVRWAGRTL